MSNGAFIAIWAAILGGCLSWRLGYEFGVDNAPQVAAAIDDQTQFFEEQDERATDWRLNPETREDACAVFFDHASDILDHERWDDIAAEDPQAIR